MKVFKQAVKVSLASIFLLSQVTTARADNDSATRALKSWGRAYQTNYHAQQNLPPETSQAERDAVTRKSFAIASRLMGAEMDKRHQELSKAELDFALRLKGKMKEISDSHKKAGLDKLSKADQMKKKREMLLARNGLKGDPTKVGKPSGAGSEVKAGPAGKKATEIGGEGGAKNVEYEKKQDLKIIDGIIQE